MSVTEYTFFSPGTTDAWRTGSMSPSPLAMLGPFNFDFSTPGLPTGIPLVTLPIGAVIYDIGIAIPIDWGGTTPFADVGTFDGGNVGVFAEIAGGAVDLSSADDDVADNAGLQQASQTAWLAAAIGSVGAAAGNDYRPWVLTVTAISTLSVVVSQNGQKGGTAVGAGQGSSAVYLLVATPYLG